MNTARVGFYQQQTEELEKKSGRLNRVHAIASWSRLIVFVAICISFTWILSHHLATGIVSGLILLAGFMVLIKYHRRIEDQRDYILALLEINKNELACCLGNYSMFDGGNEFIDVNHPYSYDIDLFGEGSFFQYLNRTITLNGRLKLVNWLKDKPLDTETILQNQKAVNELSGKVKFRQSFQAVGMQVLLTFEEQKFINDWFRQSSFFKRPVATKIALWVLPTLSFLVFLCSFYHFVPWSVFGFIVFTNLTVIGSRIKEFNRRNQKFSQAYSELKRIGKLLEQVQNEPFTSRLLNDLKNNLFNGHQSACEHIRKLNKLLDGLDNRNNIFIGVILNGLLLWDWQYLWRIEKWQLSHQLNFEKWNESLACFDALNSLANLAYNNPEFTYPIIHEGDFIFDATDIGHPLIKKEIRVCNNIKLGSDGRFAIVTGANMAGKSTFLRTVAINLILAHTGAPVCSSKLVFKPILLFTSMRTEDSLMKNESYFFAELKRLQNITLQIEQNHQVFIILDEILRGTNSEDKRKGSIGFISKIAKKDIYGLVATHDLELARLTTNEPDIFKGLCFEVLIEDNQLIFNYRLQPGVTKNMNASFLMKQMGIIE